MGVTEILGTTEKGSAKYVFLIPVLLGRVKDMDSSSFMVTARTCHKVLNPDSRFNAQLKSSVANSALQDIIQRPILVKDGNPGLLE